MIGAISDGGHMKFQTINHHVTMGYENVSLSINPDFEEADALKKIDIHGCLTNDDIGCIFVLYEQVQPCFHISLRAN